MNETISKVSPRSCVRWSLTLTSACQVRIENFMCLWSVAHMNHAKSRSGLEPVPISRLRDPSHIVFDKWVIGGVSIHYAVHPDGCWVQHWILGWNGVLDFIDEEHVCVVVLFQKLEAQPFLDLTLQNWQEHVLAVSRQVFRGLYLLDNCLREYLLLFINKVKSDLVRCEVVIGLNQFN